MRRAGPVRAAGRDRRGVPPRPALGGRAPAHAGRTGSAGEVVKANAAAQEELAKTIAERTGTDVARDVYPKLVAAVVGAGSAVAVERSLRADPPAPLALVLREVFDQVVAGLPAP